jgi:hypothetical protein
VLAARTTAALLTREQVIRAYSRRRPQPTVGPKTQGLDQHRPRFEQIRVNMPTLFDDQPSRPRRR